MLYNLYGFIDTKDVIIVSGKFLVTDPKILANLTIFIIIQTYFTVFVIYKH